MAACIHSTRDVSRIQVRGVNPSGARTDSVNIADRVFLCNFAEVIRVLSYGDLLFSPRRTSERVVLGGGVPAALAQQRRSVSTL